MRIFIGGLRESVKEQDLHKLLAPFGTVRSVDMRYSEPGPGIRIHRGFAYVEADLTPEAWKRCRNTYSKTKWFGSPKLILEVAKEAPALASAPQEQKVKKEKRVRPLIRHNLRTPVNFTDKGCPDRQHVHFAVEHFESSSEESESSDSSSMSSASEKSIAELATNCALQQVSINLDSYYQSSVPNLVKVILPDKAAWLAGRSEFRRDFKGQIKAAKRKSRIFVK